MTGASGFVSRSHRAIRPFELHRSRTEAEAASHVAAGARVHAGGVDLVEQLQRGDDIAQVVDVSQVASMKRIEVVDDSLHIGAAVTHDTIESHPLVRTHRPDVARAWATVGNVRIRRTGTVGGNLMAFDKNYDAAPILAAAGARLVWATPEGEVGTDVEGRSTERLLVRISVPLEGRVGFDRSLKPAVTVAYGDRIAIGCAYPDIHVCALDTDLGDLPEPLDDADASGAYRRRMIGVLVERLQRELA